MRPFRAKVRIIAVAGVDDGVVPEGPEHPTVDIAEELLERAGLPRLADPAREPCRG